MIRYRSLAGGAAVAPSEAIRSGTAADGGLFVPERMPCIDHAALDPEAPLAVFAAAMLAPFFAADPLAPALGNICSEAFDFPVPLVRPDAGDAQLHSLELFHGPTGAFKDFGARFLIACLDRISDGELPLTILVATSGDTGGAVGCAAEGRRGLRVFLLYPVGRVSPFQRLQLCCWRDPVRALEVAGDFDDCQAMVKQALADPVLARAHRLTSANSINIGRLLPQMTYFAAASLRLYRERGVEPGLIVPTGNLGHAVAAFYARAAGFPIGPIVAATNANRTLSDWRRTGRYEPRASEATLANAMDVGNPNNFPRLASVPGGSELFVERVDDAAIAARIATEARDTGYVWCPHSATAAEAYRRLPTAARAERPWILAATAHPFKFAEIVEPLIGRHIAPPPALAAILDREERQEAIAADPAALRERLARF